MSEYITTTKFEDHALRLFIKPEDFVGRCLHASIGVAGEAGELLDAIKKHWIYDKDLDTLNILEECGDVLFYVAVLLREVGHTLDEAMLHNVAKLEKRYPSGYTDQAARERADKGGE